MNKTILFTLLALSLSIIPTSSEIQHGVNEPLEEPPVFDLTTDGASLTLYTRLCQHSVIDKNDGDKLYVRMTRYCYCTHQTDDDSCSVPGPTILTKPNTQIKITQVNQLVGASAATNQFYHNKIKDLDVTNIHTHGLHVSPFEDDVFTITLNPQTSNQYIYTYEYHYPGTHWC